MGNGNSIWLQLVLAGYHAAAPPCGGPVDMEDNTKIALMRGVSGGHCGRKLWHMWEAVRTIRRTLLKGLP